MNKQQKNNSDTKWLGAGIGVAFIASLCCITPVLAILAGTSGIATTFSFMDPFRPYLIGLTVLLLGFAWYQKLKPSKEIDCECDPEEARFTQSKSFLGIVTVVATLLLAFPSYSHWFFSDPQPTQVQYVSEADVEHVTFKVEGMTCAGCEASVKSELGKLDGILNSEVSYNNGTATISYVRSKLTEKDLQNAINKTGFTANLQQEQENE
jgi:copper chaperone CopZ